MIPQVSTCDNTAQHAQQHRRSEIPLLLLPKPQRRVAPVVAVLAIAVAGGLGYLSHIQWDDMQRIKAENKTIPDALELHRTTKEDLGVRLTSCQGELTTTQKTTQEKDLRLTTMESDLASCQSSVKSLEVRDRRGEGAAGGVQGPHLQVPEDD